MEDVDGGYDDKTVLVTGGAGAIGGNLVRRLNDLNVEKIVILDNLSSSYEWNVPVGPKIHFVHGDILDDEKLKFVFKHRPDIVFHLAAHFANQNSVDNPETDLMVNGMGTLKVLEFAHLTDVSRFVYASSGCGVYGLDSILPYQEGDVSISLHTPYQVTKLLGELYTNYYHNLYGLPIVNTRFFNSYGPGEVPGKYRNVIPNFFYWAIRGQALPITGDGTYSFNRTETSAATYVYRTTYAGSATYPSATSLTAGVTVQSTSTVTPPLTVTAVNPANASTNIPITTAINVTFNQSIQAGANYSNITLSDGTPVPVTTSLAGTTITIMPNATLSDNTAYIITIPSNAVKNGSITLATPFTFTFTTVKS